MRRRGGQHPALIWSAAGGAILVAVLPARAFSLHAGPAGRWDLGGYVEGQAVVETNASSQRQRPAGIFAVKLNGDVGRAVRAYLDVRTIFGGPPEGAGGAGVANLTDTFQDVSPIVEVEEAYIDMFLPRVDLRVGKQKFAWGQLDTFQPADVVSPRRFFDPFLVDEDDARIGVPAIRASYFPPLPGSWPAAEIGLTLIWVPVPVAARLPLEDERWFPPAAGAPPALHIPGGVLGEGLPAVDVEVKLKSENVSPPQQLDEGAVAARLAGRSGGVDWSVYYYEGPETAPSLELTTAIVSPRAQLLVHDGLTPNVGDLLALEADVRVRPRFGHIRLAGADLAWEFGGATARAEAAYGFDRFLPRTTDDLLALDNISRATSPQIDTIIATLLQGKAAAIDLGDLFVRRDTFAWGAGVDYLYCGWTPLLQVDQTYVLNNVMSLLIADVDTRLLAALRKAFLSERLLLELVAVQSLERSSTTAMARFTYALSDSLRLRAGGLVISGSRHTLAGQYRRNDEVFLQARYSY